VKYVPPWGTTDPQAPYVNGDPTIGRQGSIPPAAAFEHPMRELVDVIQSSGIVPSEINLRQLTEGVRSQRLNYAEDTGVTPNNLIVAYDPPLTAYTRGLTLRVRVRVTNDGPCRINAGAGTMPIRKMNGADVGPGELPAGCVATLVFDGSVFQLSNFGGGGGTGEGDVFVVNVPYTVDLSPSPGTIIADFAPPITEELRSGDLLAVKVANTAPGPTVMIINGMPPIDLLPNGGGQMLQGDIAAADVVQFFYDGNALRFAPNPEMNAPVTYTIGAGQQFETVDSAVDALRRKTIGANGFVTLLLSAGIVQGPITISHPSGDRIRVRGTMIGPAPARADFSRSGNTPQLRAQDAIFNINMLRTRYGTEIRIPPSGAGISNTGPGMVQFADLLITGDQLPFPPGAVSWQQNGFSLAAGFNAQLSNVTVWGSQVGFNSGGGMYCNKCFGSWNSHCAFHEPGGPMWLTECGAFGNGNGFVCTFGSMWVLHSNAEMNGGYGFWSDNGSGAAIWWGNALGNNVDLLANVSSSVVFITPGNYATSSPAAGVVGNFNSIVAVVNIPP
jgi:hypothetical protein